MAKSATGGPCPSGNFCDGAMRFRRRGLGTRFALVSDMPDVGIHHLVAWQRAREYKIAVYEIASRLLASVASLSFVIGAPNHTISGTPQFG